MHLSRSSLGFHLHCQLKLVFLAGTFEPFGHPMAIDRNTGLSYFVLSFQIPGLCWISHSTDLGLSESWRCTCRSSGAIGKAKASWSKGWRRWFHSCFVLILCSRKMSLCAFHLVFGHTSAFFSKSFSFHFDDDCG
jgi:hypothetical protein